MALRLSILIATLPQRKYMLQDLLATITPQLTEEVEVIIDTEIKCNIGTKRNQLLNKAQGEYVVFIDDDDHVTPDYIQKIIGAARTKPDCIGISGFITTNGQNRKQWYISKKYGRWYEERGIYYRTPNHISPVKRDLALKVMFPEIAFGEDAEYSRRLLPLLKSETIITGNIYHYDFRSKK